MTTASGAPSVDRNAVLATLGDYIREIGNPDDLAYAAAELLGRSLNVSRAGYGTVDPAAETITIARGMATARGRAASKAGATGRRQPGASQPASRQRASKQASKPAS